MMFLTNNVISMYKNIRGSLLTLALILILIDVSHYQAIGAQITVNDGVREVSIPYDSIFKVFVPPVIKNETYKKYFDPLNAPPQNMNIACVIIVNPSDKVEQILTYPLYLYGNNFDKDHEVWKELEKSIDSVSKLWLIKPAIHKIPDNYPDSAKAYFTQLNQKIINGQKKSIMRPFGGYQHHVFIMNIYFGSGYSSEEPIEPMLLYWLFVLPKIQ